MMAQTEPIIEYLEGQEKVEAASTALEASREQFVEWAKDKEAYLAATRELFTEERFAAGDHVATRAAMGAIVSLKRKGGPADNRFLNVMCFQALREFPTETGPTASADHE